MLFNSIEFGFFLALVFCTYWLVLRGKTRSQNAFLLVMSYVFYGWWDWRFLSLIAFSSVVDFFVGLRMHRTEKPAARRLLLGVSLTVNLGLLFVFKYYNFFVDSFIGLFADFGIQLQPRTLHVILPVGISFYTFQTLSYTIDIYRRKIEPTRDWVTFFAFVSFFPQLVAGPIERASNLLPQFLKPRCFSYELAVDGGRQILWGLFKKVVVADNCALYVNEIFANYGQLSGGELLLGTVFFAFQIYGDFSGYSDIALGCAKLLGFRLMINFKYPYFSRDIAEFWRRWHISLSTWFRDYLYIPLGGSRGTTLLVLRNIFVIFLISGLWHGANWTFVVWGGLNALYFVPLFLFKQNRRNLDTVAAGRLLPSVREVFQILTTFLLTCLAWVFFRAENLSHALDYLGTLFTAPFLPENFRYFNQFTLSMILIMILLEWVFREKEHPFRLDELRIPLPQPVRWAAYLLVSYAVLNFINYKVEFIYFQF